MPLSQFIQDFKLRQPNGTIVFEATIEYYYEKLNGERNAEVHIVNILGTETVYIISNDPELNQLPGHFNEHENEFSYVSNFCLHIQEKKDNSICSILIFPIRKDTR